jgi:hypothetical protein
MAGNANHSTDATADIEHIDFDTPARKGWAFFTKFLLWNIIACATILILIGLMTVWS